MASNPQGIGTAVPDRWEKLQTAVENSSALNRNRRSRLLALVRNGRDLESCGRQAPADILHGKILQQLEKSPGDKAKTPGRKRLDFVGVSMALLEMARQDSLTLLEQFRPLFSDTEHRLIRRKLEYRENGLSEVSNTLNLKARGLSPEPAWHIKKELIEKIRLRSGPLAHSEMGKRFSPGYDECIGFYNTRFNITSLLKFLEIQDAGWAYDLRLYLRQLQKIEAIFS